MHKTDRSAKMRQAPVSGHYKRLIPGAPSHYHHPNHWRFDARDVSGTAREKVMQK
jgi:hypothetical protein